MPKCLFKMFIPDHKYMNFVELVFWMIKGVNCYNYYASGKNEDYAWILRIIPLNWPKSSLIQIYYSKCKNKIIINCCLKF
jgi:hypothetical protein